MLPVQRFDQALKVAIILLRAREKSSNRHFQYTEGYTVQRQKQTHLQI